MTNKEAMKKLEVILEKLDEVYDELDVVNSHLYNLNRSTVTSKDIVKHEDRNYGGYDIGLSDEGIAWVNEMYEKGYVMANDGDFEKDSYGTNRWRYTGDKDKFIIPMYIDGKLVTSHERMFHHFSSSNKLSVASNNPNVKSTANMFYTAGITELDLDLSEYDTSNVTNMEGMFGFAHVTELDLSGLNTSNVTNMGFMFVGLSATELNLSGFDTRNVTDMSYMFRDCSNLTKLDLSGFDISNVTNMYYMFDESAIEMVIVSTKEISDILSSEQYTPDNIDFKIINN